MGILWNPETDTFHMKYTLKSVLATKRDILSLISSIFDLLGLIAPALIESKWIIQQVWKKKLTRTIFYLQILQKVGKND